MVSNNKVWRARTGEVLAKPLANLQGPAIMTPNTSARMVVVKKDEKESKVRVLLQHYLDAAAPAKLAATPVLRVLAQSSQSPVVRAVVEISADLMRAGIAVEIIFAKAGEARPSMADGCSTAVRHLADTRFHDAHELMVLEPALVWLGDCMRRDPAARDSFELHGLELPETAQWAAMSFANVWARAVPVKAEAVAATANVAALANELVDLADLATVVGETNNPVTVLTRH
jgi:hypothetical protein